MPTGMDFGQAANSEQSGGYFKRIENKNFVKMIMLYTG
jgi:hypothetical protein